MSAVTLQSIQYCAYEYSGGENSRPTEIFCVKPWVIDEFNRVIHEFHVWNMN